MPALSTASTVLVTGATGFIGTWIVKDLLQKGYSVHATVRSEAKGQHLLSLFKEYEDKLKLVIVPDMTIPGAFDEAVIGVNGIIHTATPLHLHAVEPKEIIEPAVNGTMSILKSAMKNVDTLQRVVITSSCATVLGPLRRVQVSEADWDTTSVLECETKGKDADGETKYRASKVMAERAVWEFYEEHKNSVPWDVTTILPPIVFGPVLHEVASADQLVPSCLFWRQAVLEGKAYGGSLINRPGCPWVDARDVSKAHILALEKPAAGGERIIVSDGSAFVWQDFIDVAKALSPSPYPSGTVAKGDSGDRERLQTVDTSTSERVLGLKYRTMEEMTRDILADYEARGWLNVHRKLL